MTIRPVGAEFFNVDGQTKAIKIHSGNSVIKYVDERTMQ